KKDWFEFSVENGFIKSFDYHLFEKIELIAWGGYGTVHRAYLKNAGKMVALKSLHKYKDFHKDFVREDQHEFAKIEIFVKNTKPIRTCSKMLNVAKMHHCDDKYLSKNDKSLCNAQVHVAFGDIEGLKWHLDQCDYDDYRNVKNLPEFTLKNCYWKAIILVFETLKLYGANFGDIRLSLGSLVSNNSIHFPRELHQFKELMAWLSYNNCPINELKSIRGSYSLYDLLDALGLHKNWEIISLYLKYGFNPNSSYSSRLPNLLFYTIYKKFPISTLKLVLTSDVDLSKQNSDGLNALDYAANKKSIETLEYLLRNYSKNLDSQFKFSDDCPNLLFLAIKEDFPISSLKLILDSNIDLSTKNFEGSGLNAIDFAAEEKNLEALEYLLGNYLMKLNPEHAFSRSCPNLLFLAIRENYPVSTLRLILNSHIDFSIKNHDQLNAVDYAAACKNITALGYLLSNYTEGLISQHRFSHTCPNLLFFAIENFFPDHILKLILNHDVDFSTRNDAGLDVLDYADSKKNTNALEHLLRNHTKELNLQSKFSPSCPNLLFYSIHRKFPTTTLELILSTNDINLSVTNNNGLNALNYSVYAENIEALEYLLKNHPKELNSLHRFSRDDPNLLFFAIFRRFPISTITLIIRAGVDLSTNNDEGLNALEYAAKMKNMEALEYLLNGHIRKSDYKFSPSYPNILFFAIRQEFPISTLKLIIDSGINLSTRNDESQNVLDYAASWKNVKALEYLLINHRKELSSWFRFSEECPNLLFLVIKSFPVSTLILTLNIDIDLSVENKDHLNVFDYALKTGMSEKIECLIGNQKVLNFRFSPQCSNLLFYTLYKKHHISILKLILKQSLDFKTKNCDELNVLGYAVKLKKMAAIKYLLENIPQFSEKQSIAEAISQTNYFSEELSYLRGWVGDSGEIKRLQIQLRIQSNLHHL
ncbi:3398_t:CDS:2, partial [Acaulospora morrowiae]